jgi:hypothetical protein
LGMSRGKQPGTSEVCSYDSRIGLRQVLASNLLIKEISHQLQRLCGLVIESDIRKHEPTPQTPPTGHCCPRALMRDETAMATFEAGSNPIARLFTLSERGKLRTLA